ncbi:MAG: DoxX family protein [Zetaproteobacteria bacterium]|nr:DoxX family protein [Pseudobdellovibrionaceae bacterium]|tara:strand:- start:211 stop:582 length:372 start_codon:yes stop_codon:yes gene_type:complete
MAKISRLVLGIGFIFAGVMHFINPDFYLAMMPPYLPWHEFLVYFSGIIEVALGAMVVFGVQLRWAGIAMVLLLFAVFPANLHMALNPQDFPDVSTTALWGRLPFQAVFLLWVYFTLIRPEHKA